MTEKDTLTIEDGEGGTTTIKAELTRTDAASGEVAVKGTFSIQTTGKQVRTYELDVKSDPAAGTTEGTIAFSRTSSGTVKVAGTITVTAAPCAALSEKLWSLPIALDGMEETELTSLRQELVAQA